MTDLLRPKLLPAAEKKRTPRTYQLPPPPLGGDVFRTVDADGTVLMALKPDEMRVLRGYWDNKEGGRKLG